MSEFNYYKVAVQLISATPADQTAAKMLLLAHQEEAIVPLSDIYYAGVNDALGCALLSLIAEIGGFEAMAILRNVFHFEEARCQLRYAAAMGLIRNKANLSPDEISPLVAYLDDNK